MPEYRKSAPYPIEPEVVDRLLDRLASGDQAFRDAYMQDYFGELRKLGHKPPPDRPDGPCCDPPHGPIAPPEQIAAARQALRAELVKWNEFHQNLLVSPPGRKPDTDV